MLESGGSEFNNALDEQKLGCEGSQFYHKFLYSCMLSLILTTLRFIAETGFWQSNNHA